jgi:hypothetical protein
LITTILVGCSDDSGPAITGTPARTATVGQAYRFQPNAVHLSKGHRPSFTITNRPAWASFNSSSGKLTGTPTASDVGMFPNIEIGLVADTVHASLPTFSITVVPPQPVAPQPVAPQPVASAASAVTVSWEAPTDNTNGSLLTNLSGYKIYYGGASRDYSSTIQVSNAGLTTYVVENLSPGQYYFAVTALNSFGEESDFSPEMSTSVD